MNRRKRRTEKKKKKRLMASFVAKVLRHLHV